MERLGCALFMYACTCDALRDLVAFVQFKQREKQPWRSVNFKPATLLKLTLLHGCFSRSLNSAEVSNCTMHHIFSCYLFPMAAEVL